MTRELCYMVPHSIVHLENACTTVANVQEIDNVAVGQLSKCQLTMYIPFVVQNLCSASHMRRNGKNPEHINAETEYIEEDGLLVYTRVVRQYHYQNTIKIHVCMMEQNST